MNLAAIVYRPADDVDNLLARFAGDLIGRGHRLGGIVQRNVKGERGEPERMEVIDLMTGKAVRICQYLGKDATACKLNPAGLAEAAMLVAGAVAADVELVVVNKFSKQEAAGRGLRAEIADAVTAGLPLLTAVSDNCYEAWMRFTGGFGTTLLCERRVVEDWWETHAGTIDTGIISAIGNTPRLSEKQRRACCEYARLSRNRHAPGLGP